MPGDSPLIFYYHRLNSYSFNTLAGVIDSDSELQDIPIGLALTEDRLHMLVAEALRKKPHATIALSVLTCQFSETEQLLRQLRARHGGRLTILAGGPHVTARPEDILNAGADIAFRGEAEANFLEVLHNINQGLNCDSIQFSNKPADIDAFYSISPKRGMFGPIEITRGCAFACRFCQTSHIFGTRLRHRSIEKIVQQAEALRSINRKVVRLLSPNALSYGSPDGRQLNLKAIHDLLSALRTTLSFSGKIIFAHFPSEARPEHVTPDTLRLLKEFADNDEIVIGAQSGSQHMLDACHRAHTVEHILTAVALARKYGYKVIVDFIFGLPGESEEDVQESLRVMAQLARMGARVHPHTFAPLPQTAFSNKQPGILSPLVSQALEEFRMQQKIYENAPKSAKSGKQNWNCSPFLKT
jgi:B12-binding domain/radical SAM domain protein